MPPVGEVVDQKPLSGAELQKIILADVATAMSRNCIVSGVSAFGQVSYEVTVKLHFQNLSFPEASIDVTSRQVTPSEIAADPGRANIQGPPPLDGEGETVASEVAREITNPTQARVEFEIPVPVLKPGPTGRSVEATAKYPKGAAPPTKATVTDRTEDARAEFAEKRRKRGK